MGPLTRLLRFLFMIAPLTSFSCPIGRTRSSMSQRMTHDWLSPRGLISLPLSTRLSNPAHGHKVSFGVLGHHFAISLRLNSTMLMILFQRSVLPVRAYSSYPQLILMFFQPRNSDRGSVCALITRRSKTSSTCPMISFTTSQKMGGIASDKHSGTLSLSTPTLLRSYSCRS